MSSDRKQGQPTDPTLPAFAVGDRVRVRRGVHEPELPDIPIGGWCGSITEVDASEAPYSYLIAWDARTLREMHPIYVKRCRRDDLDIDKCWLDETDLEIDAGEQLPIEKPTDLVTRPLDPANEEDRVRAVFGLTSDDPIPDVSDETLTTYYRHLERELKFPLTARYTEETAPRKYKSGQLNVVRLGPRQDCDVDEGIVVVARIDDEEGLLPIWVLEADGATEKQVIRDYAHWFQNWAASPDVLQFPGMEAQNGGEGAAGSRMFWRLLNRSAAGGAIFGATTGAIQAVMENAQLAMMIGAGVFAALCGYLGFRIGARIAAINPVIGNGALIGLLLGMVAGAVLGVVLGALAIAYLGSIIGSIAGVMLIELFGPTGRKDRLKLVCGAGGAALGAVTLCLINDHERALLGMAVGAVIGAVGAIFVVLVVLVTLSITIYRRQG